MTSGVMMGTIVKANGFFLHEKDPSSKMDSESDFVRLVFGLLGLALVLIGATIRGFAGVCVCVCVGARVGAVGANARVCMCASE